MKKEHIVIIILSVLLLVSSIGWISSYFGFRPFGIGKSWGWDPTNGNNYWSGTGYKHTTNTFVITGEEWRISWGFSPDNEHTYCYVSIHDAYTDDEIRSTRLYGKEEQVYMNVTGRFYLQIEFFQASFESWYVEVLEFQSSNESKKQV